MGVIQSQERAVLVVVVIDQRGVECAAAEDAGPDKIPKGRAKDVGVGEPLNESLLSLDQSKLSMGGNQQHQRQQ